MTDAETIERLKRIAGELHCWALRYVDGRRSYTVDLFNNYTAELLSMGVDLNPGVEQKLFARDGFEAFTLPEKYAKLEREYVEAQKERA